MTEPSAGRTESFPTPTPVTLRVRHDVGGRVIVSAQPGLASSEVTLVPRPGDTGALRLVERANVVLASEDLLVVDVPSGGPLRRTPEVDVRVSVPAGSSMVLESGGADLTVRGPVGLARVSTGSGDVTLDDVDGDLVVTTGSGDQRIGRAGGGARLHTGSGDISVAALAGDSDLKSASGDVRIVEAAGTVTVRTASGDIRLEVAGAGRVELRSASGDLSVGVRAGVPTWLDLSSLSGRVHSGLAPLPGSPPAADGESLSLRAGTLSGDVVVATAPAAYAARLG